MVMSAGRLVAGRTVGGAGRRLGIDAARDGPPSRLKRAEQDARRLMRSLVERAALIVRLDAELALASGWETDLRARLTAFCHSPSAGDPLTREVSGGNPKRFFHCVALPSRWVSRSFVAVP